MSSLKNIPAVAPLLLLLLGFLDHHRFALAMDVSGRVIGGQFASMGQFPHQVSLQLNGRHHCGGSLISNTMIVTAAHCTVGQNPGQMRAVVGTNDLSAGNGQSFAIAQLIIHPQYNPQSQDFDMSLIRLSSPVSLGGPVQTIELVDADTNFAADTMATISGFGAINQNLQLPNRLMFAQVQLWSRDFCNAQNIPGLTDRMVCAGHPSGQVSSCQGDSGGPLTVDGKLFGVVSWGFGCGAKGRPAMYTYVGALRAWIRQNANV